jgi:hypothetical protein
VLTQVLSSAGLLGTSNKKYPQKKAPAAGLVIAGMTLGTAWAVVGMTIATIGL